MSPQKEQAAFSGPVKQKPESSPLQTHGLHVEDGRLYKASAQVVDDKGGDAGGHPVLAQAAYHEHLLELVTVALPLTWRHTHRSSEEGQVRAQMGVGGHCWF